MSLYGMMRTGVSGMNAQANRLSAVADNIANANTTGYKRSSIEFSSLVVPTTPGTYTSGGVEASVRYANSAQGDLRYTSSTTDLAINGDGFFVVQDDAGNTFLTRAGSFVPDDEGRLVNAAGFYLLGYSYENGEPTAVANDFGGMEQVIIEQSELEAAASTSGTFSANLPVTADIVAAASLPSTNDPAAVYSAKSSLVTYDNVGNEVIVDVYYTKTAANTWEVAVYNQADASAGGFPYASAALTTETLTFDPVTGKLDAGSANSLTLTVPNGQPLTLDLADMTELGTGYTVVTATVNGNAPSAIESVEISTEGVVYAQYENGTFRELYKIPLATVTSPDQLEVLPGNVLALSPESGGLRVGFAGEAGFGDVVSGALENANVDIAEELTAMIEAQRSYTANSKVFQTGADLMDILVNLKR